MNKKQRVKVKAGDIFILPINDETVGVGRVANALQDTVFLVVYEGQWAKAEIPSINKILDLPIAFASESLDAKLRSGSWPLIGHSCDGLDDIARPVFKAYQSEDNTYYIQTLFESKCRLATSKEILLLHKPFFVSPIRLEKAIKSLYGEREWNDDFEKLKYSEVVKSSHIMIE